MKYLLILLIYSLNYSSLYSQCSPIGYKTLTDSVFSNNDKVLCPTIVYNQPGGFRILKEKSDTSLFIIAEFIKKNSDLKFEIGSHTDQRGSEKFNLVSSQKRAESIKDYLIREYNVTPSQLLTKGLGESKPLVSIDVIQEEENKQKQEEMYACNRRTELRVIKN